MHTLREESRFSEPVIKVWAEAAGRRLDLFLSGQYEGFSRSHFKKLIREGEVLINGQSVKPSYEIRFGDEISVRLPSLHAGEQLTPEALPLDVLYEDEDIIVINKAPGIVVHPGAGHEKGTLVHGLLAHCSRLAFQGAPLRPGIVHRLDRDTSGALVVAKSERAYLNLIDQFKDHQVHKEYLALVYGRFSQPRGEIRTYLDRNPHDRKKISVMQEEKGREAISLWEVKQQWNEVTLLRVIIKTGRTHQIRVHLSHLQHPVVGDPVYGGGKRRARSLISNLLKQKLTSIDRQMLHAWHLGFRHPETQAPLFFTAPLPSDFSCLLEQIQQLYSEKADD